MTRVLVVIPWRSKPHRVYAYHLTVARYRELLPDAMIASVDTSHEPFCLAACRNRGVRLAEDGGFDAVVLGDADTLPEQEPLLAAIEACQTSRLVHLPYTEYRSLGQTGTRQHLAGAPLEDCEHVTIPYATSGVYVTTPAAWWASGGQDERFKGWAPEDMAWLISHRALLGAEPARHEGRVYAFHHDSPSKQGDTYDAAVALYQRYLQAGDSGDSEAVRVLLKEQSAEQQIA